MKRILLTALTLLAIAATIGSATVFAEKRNVAILVWRGAELLDYAGPAEVFSAAGRGRLFRVHMVGLDRKPAPAARGAVTINPDYTLEDCPTPDIIVIPGGDMGPVEGNKVVLDWIKKHAPKAEIVMSVCTGAFVLADTGLLDGLSATTHHNGYDWLERGYPKIKVVRTERFVDNGKFITAGGVSAGIDGALHVVERLHGREVTEKLVRWMEYRGYQPGQEPAQ